MTRWLVCALLGLLLALPTGCRRSARDQKMQLAIPFHMSLTGQRFLMRTRMSSMRLRKRLELGLRKSKHIVLSGAKKKSLYSYQLEISATMRRVSKRFQRSWRRAKKLRARVLVTGQLTPLGKGGETLLFEEYADIHFRPLRPPSIDQIQQAIVDAWGQLERSIALYAKMRRQKDEAVLAGLRGNDLLAQRHAALILGQRKNAKAALLLIKRLGSKDERVVTAAVGAIVKLKDKRAALPLIKASSNRRAAFLMQVISALSVLGGDDAQSYLFTLANAHDNKRVRQSASEGLQELQKRAARAARTNRPSKRRASSG